LPWPRARCDLIGASEEGGAFVSHFKLNRAAALTEWRGLCAV
jgi:hypothetical protein